ncbi:MAG: hypothetical protein ABI789_07705 [Usitatibacter sp.]
MTAKPIPESVRRFVATSIPSVPFLEALLVIRAAAGEPVPVLAVAERLYISERSAGDLVRALHEAHFVRPVDAGGMGYRFDPADEGLSRLVEDIAHHYQDNLIGMTELIHSKTARSAVQFADAFKFRKEP